MALPHGFPGFHFVGLSVHRVWLYVACYEVLELEESYHLTPYPTSETTPRWLKSLTFCIALNNNSTF